MITDNLPSLNDRAVILLPDDGAVLALAEHGIAAMDWLFLSGAEVVIPDRVRHELLRGRHSGEPDYNPVQRPQLAEWFEKNAERISSLVPGTFHRLPDDAERWEKAGYGVGGTPPGWDDDFRAEHAVAVIERLFERDGSRSRILAIANHDRTRAAIRGMEADAVVLTGSLRFVGMVAGEYRIEKAIRIVTREFA